MNSQPYIPRKASIAISDLLDYCTKVKHGQKILLLAHIDGLYGGDNLVDREAISWIQSSVEQRGAYASVLWIDEIVKPHAWRFPEVLKTALESCDILINHSFDIVWEEIVEFRQFIWENKLPMIRNFATTAPLLCSDWAQTPQELLDEIRYQAAVPFEAGKTWQLTDDNGTCLEGIIEPVFNPNHPSFTSYTIRREEAGPYRPWPEWVVPPIRLSKVNGTFIFDRMLSWWSRYIGISPYFNSSIKIAVKDSRIEEIKGGEEAVALERFLKVMKERLGDAVYDFNCLHFGIHPNAHVESHQCPNILYRRLIEHSHSSNIHVHIGAPPPNANYNYWMHCTGDINTASFKVGDAIIHDHGYLTVLQNPQVLKIAAKYPERPGVEI